MKSLSLFDYGRVVGRVWSRASRSLKYFSSFRLCLSLEVEGSW